MHRVILGADGRRMNPVHQHEKTPFPIDVPICGLCFNSYCWIAAVFTREYVGRYLLCLTSIQVVGCEVV